MRRTSFLLNIIAIGMLAGCSSKSGHQRVSKLENKPAPDFELTALDGGRVKLSELRGKPVLLAFFAYG
jgi:cytochrome oxidase Cu insertion factor (SCO1/SenC/PrrC family)